VKTIVIMIAMILSVMQFTVAKYFYASRAKLPLQNENTLGLPT
jgi:hypothetical protein